MTKKSSRLLPYWQKKTNSHHGPKRYYAKEICSWNEVKLMLATVPSAIGQKDSYNGIPRYIKTKELVFNVKQT